jgi:hypothetical protein
MKDMKAITNFFHNGVLVREGEIISCDNEAREQFLEEELAEDVEKVKK